MRYRLWTHNDQVTLEALLAKGISARRVALAMKRPLSTIKQRARDMGRPFPHEVDLKRERKKLLGAPTAARH